MFPQDELEHLKIQSETEIVIKSQQAFTYTMKLLIYYLKKKCLFVSEES